MSRSYFRIPLFARPGQVNAFADRESKLRKLFGMVVSAGNSVRAGDADVQRAAIVHGYMGSGKSALLLETLAMLRGEGQRPGVLTGLPTPDAPERWIIMRLSGKHIGNPSAFGDAVRQLGTEEFDKPVFSIAKDITRAADKSVPPVTRLPMFSRALRAERKLFNQVREALDGAKVAMEYTRQWYGARATQAQKSHTAASIEAELKARFGSDFSGGAVKLASQIIMKIGADISTDLEVERQWRVGTEIVVHALNTFFEACHAARLPTVLLLDDFDEFTSSIGPDYDRRAKVLSWLLGTVNEFAPTCLLLGLRQEYEIPDIARQMERVYLPPMTPVQFGQVIDVWAAAQHKPLSADESGELKALARHLFASTEREEPILLPYRCLRVLTSVWEDGGTLQTPARAHFERFFSMNYRAIVRRAVQKLAKTLTATQIQAIAETIGIELDEELLSADEHFYLVQAGLVRPSVAGEASDRLLFDPLIAYVAFAQQQVQTDA